ncbi:MAG: DUF4163 domain-containing protein [Chitinophagales bacterium]|nr:DUF4163 domain-containing protein [Chitinophagales bacterium]
MNSPIVGINRNINLQIENEISIERVNVERIELKKICFEIGRSSYPKIVGMDDMIFQEQLNNIFKSKFEEFIESEKKSMSGDPCDENEGSFLSTIPPSVSSSFDILTHNDSIISIVQYFASTTGGGGNAMDISSSIVNCDLKNRIVLSNFALGMSYNKLDDVNQKMIYFFDTMFPEYTENEKDYPVISGEERFNKLSFGLQNDSIVLFIEATPIYFRYSHDIYRIPIDKWNIH